MLKASQFVPVEFEATVIGFDLTKSVGRLAARLLAAHGDAIDDEFGVHLPKRSDASGQLQLYFRDQGLLTVTPAWASFQGSLPEDVRPDSDPASESMRWAVDILMSIMSTQKAMVMALNLEVTWLLSEHSTTAPLVAYFGCSHALGGIFAASEDFEIRGDTTTELPDLFPVRCEVLAGRLGNFADPENVGVQIKYRSPDRRVQTDVAVDFTRATVDQFFVIAPQVMERQLTKFFPIGGAT